MKKFSFSLDAVHKFKSQILDSLQNELAIIVSQVKKKQKEIDGKKALVANVNQEFVDKSKGGINVLEISYYKAYIKRLERELEADYEKLEELIELEQEKKDEVIEAKKENLSLDKLKEKRLDEYNTMVAKSEELVVEEFVVNSMSAQR